MQGVLIAALLLAPADDQVFCDGLRQIVAAAPGDFKALESADPYDGTVGIGFTWSQNRCHIQGPIYDEAKQNTRIYACQKDFLCPDSLPREAMPCEPSDYRQGEEPSYQRLLDLAIRAAKCFNVPVYRDDKWWGRSMAPGYVVVVPGARIHASYYAMFGMHGPRLYPPGSKQPPQVPHGYALVLQVSRALPD